MGYETELQATSGTIFCPRMKQKSGALILIIAAGGDGTINEVVNGINGSQIVRRWPLSPTGTTRDYAACLEGPDGRSCGSCPHCEKIKAIQMDIGRAYGASISSTLLQQEQS